MHWLEKRFVATYSALCSINLPDDQTERLAGITEIGNTREGYPSARRSVDSSQAGTRCISTWRTSWRRTSGWCWSSGTGTRKRGDAMGIVFWMVVIAFVLCAASVKSKS